MPFKNCIAAALADQLVTLDEADHYNATYDRFESDFRAHMPPDEAAGEAARATFHYIDEQAAERRRQTFLALSAQKDLTRRLDTFVSPFSGKNDPYAAAKSVLSRVTHGRAGELSVEGQHDYWRGMALAQMDEAHKTWKRGRFAQRRQAPRMANIVREVFGENSGDTAAQALAKGWTRASEQLRQAYNRFGGHIGHLEDWGLPQSHDRLLVRRAGVKGWVDFTLPLLDRSRMLDRATGLPLGDAALRSVLEDVHQNIRTQGWASRGEAMAGGGTSLANRRGTARVLHFKDAASWSHYADRFGHNDPIDAMMGHIDGMARDIGAMQVMGPNPKSMLGWLKNDLARRYALETGDADPTWKQLFKEYLKDKGLATNDPLDSMWAAYTHANSAPAHPIIADIADDITNIVVAAQIPGVLPMALTGDFNTARLTAKFNGIPVTKVMTEYLRQFNLLNREHRLLALHAGIEAQHYGQSVVRHGRYMMEIAGHQWSRWLSDRAVAASGLTAHTTAGRAAMGLAVFGHMARESAKPFAGLDTKFAGMLTRFGIDAQDWDTIRATAPYTLSSGAKFIRPGDILERGDLDQSRALTLSSKVADAANLLAEYAVPSSTLQGRALFQGVSRRGTPRNIITQSTSLYHQYGTSIILTHGLEAFAQHSAAQKLKYAAGLIISSTVAAALSIQFRELAAFRDPRDMEDPKFWGTAMAQGGGAGIFGDFVNAGLQGTSRTGKGLTEMLAGSPAGFVSDATNTLLGNALGAAAKQTPLHQNYLTGVMGFAKQYAPGSSLWYARAAMEREIWDQLQAQIDPGWPRRARNVERWYQRQYGNDYWWHRGDTLPSRAPDLSKAAGGPQ